ncbi:hypothetical protein DUI87_18823 [Hirundo rustica rustica]|uniref:Uncharacterized protein n=1 Tax=Hirundo rustica rustica TaxID=333673 RepID=A0A3M0JU87_HIRRU|nr:hypothetical protein DUI87_18823 [Hirundo rustica rustica]
MLQLAVLAVQHQRPPAQRRMHLRKRNHQRWILARQIEKMIHKIRNSLPVKAPSAQGNNNVAPESPREDPMNRAAAEEVSSGTESCRNSSPEPEEPGLHRVQVVSSCDLSNGESMDPTGMALMGGISSPSSWDPGALQCPTVPPITQRCWESKGIMVEQMKLCLGHTSVEGPQNTSDMDGRLWSTKILINWYP